MKFLHKFAAATLFLAAAPAAAQTGAVRIEHPWSRATPAGATAGAAYMTIENARKRRGPPDRRVVECRGRDRSP